LSRCNGARKPASGRDTRRTSSTLSKNRFKQAISKEFAQARRKGVAGAGLCVNQKVNPAAPRAPRVNRKIAISPSKDVLTRPREHVSLWGLIG